MCNSHFLAHAYVWGDLVPSKILCKSIANLGQK